MDGMGLDLWLWLFVLLSNGSQWLQQSVSSRAVCVDGIDFWHQWQDLKMTRPTFFSLSHNLIRGIEPSCVRLIIVFLPNNIELAALWYVSSLTVTVGGNIGILSDSNER